MTQDATPEDRLGDFTADARLLTLTLIAVVIGVISAVVALALVRLIGFFTNVFYFHQLGSALRSPAESPLGLWTLPIPIVGGLLVGLIARYGSAGIRGHGIPEAIDAILSRQSRMDVKVAVLKPVSSALAIGTGGPFGAEGPIIMTGGAFGSLVAQAFHLSSNERKTLLAAGAAGGMAAIFATPVAATVLAIELLLFEWKPRSFIPVAASAAIAGLLRVPLLGAGPLFPLPPHVIPGALDCVGIGLAGGALAALVTAMVYRCEDLFGRLPMHWMWWPALGGAVIGVGGLLVPRALGVGYDTIGQMLQGNLGGALLLALLAGKAVLWSVGLASGTSGGVLAPLLFMGAALGGLEAHWLHAPNHGMWSALSMAAMMAGAMNAPLTAIIFTLELTGDVAALPALLVACMAADALTVLVMRRSILTEKLARRGRHVMREYTVNPLHRLRVEEVMERGVPTLPAGLKVDALFRRLANEDPELGRRQAWPITDDAGDLAGIITRGDLVLALESDQDGAETKSVLDVGHRDVVVTYPDELLEEATEKMLRHQVGRLPVVLRDRPRELVGILGRPGIMAAWLHVAREEGQREPGWLSQPLDSLRHALKRVLLRDAHEVKTP